ncbi:hypothetical protein E2562_030557 [Oryza meyeriana var. granulata]|uniref:Uncharacterized protein n=1 Tax=Oryza meyeriana var. granulata TaxID=110450 RepID=A0A6G1D8H1_9ORYZ|nr:hypothetical protein E2562_030557 [Oryza meyeriana var. granulata]
MQSPLGILRARSAMKRPWASAEDRGQHVEPPPLVGAATALIVAEVARTPDPPRMRGRDTFPVTSDPHRRAHPYRRSLAPPGPVTRAQRRARRGFGMVAGRTEGASPKAARPSWLEEEAAAVVSGDWSFTAFPFHNRDVLSTSTPAPLVLNMDAAIAAMFDFPEATPMSSAEPVG